MGEADPDELELSFNLENSMCDISSSFSILLLVMVQPRVNLQSWATNREMGEVPTNNFH